MSGLGLIHAGFLAATAAVAVPILIHLLMRPQARAETIGSVRFLRLVLQRSTRRRNIRRWLLLALRTLAVLALALLFARPYLATPGGPGRDRLVLVLLDRSASMWATESGRTLFAAAKQAALDIVAKQPEGTEVRLAWFADRGPEAASDLRLDEPPQPGYASTDYGLALAWARDELALSPRRYRKVFLLTDLQLSGLHRSACPGFQAEVEVDIRELGRRPAANLAVDRAEASQTTLRGGQPVIVAAQVANLGLFPARDVAVRLVLEAEGASVDQTQKISVAPGANQAVSFSVPIEKPGQYQGYVEVSGDDGYPIDDRRWLAFEAQQPDRLLLVDGEPGASVFGNETYYLEAALRLAVAGQGAPLTPFEPVRLALSGPQSLPDLSEYRVVMLCNVAALSAADSSRLDRYVAAGGRLLVFAGAKLQPEGYAAVQQAGLMPATIGIQADPASYRMQTWDKEHPIFRPLSDPQQGDLRRLVFRRIVRMKANSEAKVLAATDGGDPLLVEKSRGRGTVLLFAAAADRQWGDWPQSRLYVPLVHQIVGYLTDRLPENARVRSELAGQGADDSPQIREVNGLTVVRNLDPRESRTERCTIHEFRRAFDLAEEKPQGEAESVAATAGPDDSQRPDEWWPYLVWALLLVLVAEVFVANRSHA